MFSNCVGRVLPCAKCGIKEWGSKYDPKPNKQHEVS